MRSMCGHIVVAAALMMAAGTCSSCYAQEQVTDECEVFNIEYRLPQVPDYVVFAGQKVDLSRYDMHERFEREMTAACYMHSNTTLTMKRANRYLPEIVPILEKENIPLDFIYLAAIESAFNPLAVSGAGAAGIWQFMAGTAREYGLEVNDYVDERYHVTKATKAACKYLHNSYKLYGNWIDAAASYNAGTKRITSELSKQQVDNYFDLQLVEETSRYVFRILAAKKMYENPSAYGFILSRTQLYQPIATKTVKVNTPIDDLATWAKEQGITYKQLKDFNPWLRGRSLPNKSGKVYEIAIPIKEDMYYTSDREYKVYNENWVID